MDNNQTLIEVLEYVKSKITATAYSMWISVIELDNLDNTTATLKLPKELHLSVIKSEYRSLFEEAFENVLGHKLAVEFTCNDISNEMDIKKDTNTSLQKMSFGKSLDSVLNNN